MADWQQLHFNTNPAQAETLEPTLMELGCLAITYKDAGNQDAYQLNPGDFPQWDNTVLTALFNENTDLQYVTQQLDNQYQSLDYFSEQLPDQQWERAWLNDFKPMQFGKNTWICPTGFDIPDKTAINILLDPGLAFGTGTHPTTALCLQWIDTHNVSNKTVIDYGCGSGILAIAASMHGAEKVYATDHDNQAMIATQQNAKRNNVTLNCYLPEDLPAIKADIMIANILAGPLVELAETLANLTKTDGTIVLSGILNTQADQIIEAYRAFFTDFTIQQQDDWLCITAAKI